MHECNFTNQMKNTCEYSISVHDAEGDDFFDGTFEKPLKIVSTALSFARLLRATRGSVSMLCITNRNGMYYLGTNATTFSSQIGAIDLMSNDSNFIIENY